MLRENLAQYVVLSDMGKIMAVKEYRSKVPLDFADFFDAFCLQDYFVKEQYASSIVMYGVPEFTLIPTVHFVPQQIQAFAAATIKSEFQHDQLSYCELKGSGATAVFTLPFGVKQKCDHYLNKPTYLPVCQPAVFMALSLSEKYRDLVLINMFGDQFIITAIRDGKLHLCNAYDFSGVTDIVYFVQLVVEVVRMDLAKTALLIAGEFERDSELMRQLLKFIPSLRIPEAELSARFATQSDKLPHWRYAFLSY